MLLQPTDRVLAKVALNIMATVVNLLTNGDYKKGAAFMTGATIAETEGNPALRAAMSQLVREVRQEAEAEASGSAQSVMAGPRMSPAQD